MTLERGSHIEITPEPTPEERAAILAALEQVQAEDEGTGSGWWEAALRENVEDEG